MFTHDSESVSLHDCFNRLIKTEKFIKVTGRHVHRKWKRFMIETVA